MIIGIAALIASFIYIKTGAFKFFYHDILGWHQPSATAWSDRCSFHSKCKYCGKEIMMDSQGNWF
jgi:hypothetical protein